MGANLYWCTLKENNLKAWKDGLCKNTGFKPGCKAHQMRMIKIIKYDYFNEPLEEYNSAREVERLLKIDSSSIIKCCKGNRFSAGGFRWKYKQ